MRWWISLHHLALLFPTAFHATALFAISPHLIASGLDTFLHQPRHDFRADDVPTECLLGNEFEGAESWARVSVQDNASVTSRKIISSAGRSREL